MKKIAFASCGAVFLCIVTVRCKQPAARRDAFVINNIRRNFHFLLIFFCCIAPRRFPGQGYQCSCIGFTVLLWVGKGYVNSTLLRSAGYYSRQWSRNGESNPGLLITNQLHCRCAIPACPGAGPGRVTSEAQTARSGRRPCGICSFPPSCNARTALACSALRGMCSTGL